MQHRASLLAPAQDAPESERPEASSAFDLAPSRFLTLLIGPQPSNLAEVGAAVNEALPGHAMVVCADVRQALTKADNARALGWAPVIFILDYRGRHVGDFADQLREVRAASPDSELMILLDEGDMALWRAAMQIIQSPGKLTFLLTPFYRPDAVAAIKAVAERHQAVGELHRWMHTSGAAVRNLHIEVQELTAKLEIARHAAHHDVLTGILNRAGFVEELTARLARDRRKQTVLMIDLDRFKSVNDTLGHHAGDDLVRKVCAAMGAVLPPGGVLARLGGDEFGIIVEEVSVQGLRDFCNLLLRVCNQMRRIAGNEVQISASVGVARQGDNTSEVAMMRRADLALYAAKRDGRNRYRFYDSDLERATKHRLSIESGLEQALRDGQFRMAYQPIVAAATAEVLGFEALVRWDSPKHGDVPPSEFVPIAEETGLILDLGDWITRQSFKDCRRWPSGYVSVNLSARQFLRQNVAERILRYAEEADLAPQRIQIELTETAIIDDVERAAHNLKVLRHAGVRVALDDFGTGYSSLTYLNQFAIDCIKIDKSFVDNIARDRQSAIIVASVTRLASSLGMGVVAEGVETDEQREVLIAAGCGSLQGFRFGKPMTPNEAGALLPAAAGTDKPRASLLRSGRGMRMAD